jgi:hypothetical protein
MPCVLIPGGIVDYSGPGFGYDHDYQRAANISDAILSHIRADNEIEKIEVELKSILKGDTNAS